MICAKCGIFTGEEGEPILGIDREDGTDVLCDNCEDTKDDCSTCEGSGGGPDPATRCETCRGTGLTKAFDFGG